MAAMLVLVLAARAYENKGRLDIGPINVDLSPSGENNTFMLAMGIALIILLASVFVGLYQQIIITRIGRKFFEETLDDTRARLREAAIKGDSYEAPGFMRMLQRDSRYLSISYMRTLNLLQPGLLVLVFLIYAISAMPVAAGFLTAGCLLMVPAHIYMSKWSARTSEDIQTAAKFKSDEERDYIAAVSSDPFVKDWDARYQSTERPSGEDGFITAFVNRQRIGAYSQFITDTAMALVLILVVVVLARMGGSAVLSLSSIMILLILFRLIMGYVSKFAQAITMVSSYEPFFRDLLDLYDGDEQELGIKLNGDLREPVRVVAFQNGQMSRADGQFYARALGLDIPIHYVRADYVASGRREAIAPTADFDLKGLLDYDPGLTKTIKAFLDGDMQDLSAREKYMLSYVAALQDESALILCAGDMWDKLSKDDLRFIVSSAKGKNFVLIYHRPPGKLILPPRFQVAARTRGSLNILCNADGYRENRSKIVNAIANERRVVPTPISADDVETF